MVNIYSSVVKKKAQVLDRRADRVLSRQGEVDSVYRTDAHCSIKSGRIAISQCQTLNKYQPYNNHHLVAEVNIKAITFEKLNVC